MDAVLLIHFAACAFMTGVIWSVQLIIYPNFAEVPSERFARFHARHSVTITRIVFPAMSLELATAIVLLMRFGDQGVWWLNLASVLLIWICTAALSVPIHNSLSRSGDDPARIQRLIRTNWYRSALWSGRLIFLSWLILKLAR